MNEILDRIKQMARQRPWFVGGAGALFSLLVVVVSSNNTTVKKGKVAEKTKIETPVTASTEKSGIFLSEDIDRKAFVSRLEGQYHAAEDKNRALEERVSLLEKKLSESMKGQETAHENIRLLEDKIADALNAAKVPGLAEGAANYRLEVVNLGQVSAVEPEGVYLPPGSFVRGTLLTGVYAPVDQNNPLPVLIRLNEAFYGPNETRVPLEGAFLIGKASGELNSERALVQGVTLSAVLPNGEVFQHKGNIGYVTDVHGELGLKGTVVRNTGEQLAASFMGGFTSGAAQAFSDAEVTQTSSSNGRVMRNVTGNTTRYAAFQGLSSSAAQLSKYYADQLNAIVPAVRVEAGVDLYLVILEGAKINGLKVHKSAGRRYLD